MKLNADKFSLTKYQKERRVKKENDRGNIKPLSRIKIVPRATGAFVILVHYNIWWNVLIPAEVAHLGMVEVKKYLEEHYRNSNTMPAMAVRKYVLPLFDPEIEGIQHDDLLQPECRDARNLIERALEGEA